jgi:hypothetical protein
MLKNIFIKDLFRHENTIIHNVLVSFFRLLIISVIIFFISFFDANARADNGEHLVQEQIENFPEFAILTAAGVFGLIGLALLIRFFNRRSEKADTSPSDSVDLTPTDLLSSKNSINLKSDLSLSFYKHQSKRRNYLQTILSLYK